MVDGSLDGRFDVAAADAGVSQVEVVIVDVVDGENWAFSIVEAVVGEEVVEDAVVESMEDVAHDGLIDIPDMAGGVVSSWP